MWVEVKDPICFPLFQESNLPRWERAIQKIGRLSAAFGSAHLLAIHLLSEEWERDQTPSYPLDRSSRFIRESRIIHQFGIDGHCTCPFRRMSGSWSVRYIVPSYVPVGTLDGFHHPVMNSSRSRTFPPGYHRALTRIQRPYDDPFTSHTQDRRVDKATVAFATQVIRETITPNRTMVGSKRTRNSNL